MLTEEQVKALIVERMLAATESCNSHHINHVEGQIRALCTVVNGSPLPAGASVSEVCKHAGIPCHDDSGGFVSFDDDWLTEHGFSVTEDTIRVVKPLWGGK